MLRIHYAPDERSGSADASKRLAERFGIPEEEVKKLLASKPNDTASLPKIEPVMIQNRESRSGWNPIATLGTLLGVIGILSLVVVIMMMMRHHHEPMMSYMPPSIMQPPPAQAPPAVIPDTVSAPAEQSIEEAKPEAPVKPKRRISRQSSGFKTSNSMEAEERLAELRAEGNSKAKIRSTKKNGVLMFEVK